MKRDGNIKGCNDEGFSIAVVKKNRMEERGCEKKGCDDKRVW